MSIDADRLNEARRAINALRLEVPNEVWVDVSAKVEAALDAAEQERDDGVVWLTRNEALQVRDTIRAAYNGSPWRKHLLALLDSRLGAERRAALTTHPEADDG